MMLTSWERQVPACVRRKLTKIKIRISNEKEVETQIAYITKENEKEDLVILKIEKYVEELINYRKITFNLIWWDASGLKIPNQAIVQENDLNYVIRNRAGYLSKILVKVKKQGEKYSIVEAYKTEELKELGFTEKEINSYRKISLYDEILINPNLDKTKELN